MVCKFPSATKNRLIVIQFLDNDECQTGYSLSKNVMQSSPYIGSVDFFASSNRDDILNYIYNDIPNIIAKDEIIAVYIDSHGFDTNNGIGHKNGFISWEELVAAIKIAFNTLETRPTIILTACNGISIKNTIAKLEEPICSKLYAGDGVMLNGPVMGAFVRLFNNYGLDFGIKEVNILNQELANRNNPPFIYIDYQ
jgi:hypothetical protein|nr:hypothetical protein [Bacteroides intestinalis]